MYSISEGFKEAVQNKKISAVRSRFFTLIARRPSGNEIQAYVTYCLTHGIGEDELYMPDSGETFNQLKTEWTPAYWTDLGSEMQMKFSKKRITHMIEVANYLFPEPVQDNAKKKSEDYAQYQYRPARTTPYRQKRTGIGTTIAIIAAAAGFVLLALLFRNK